MIRYHIIPVEADGVTLADITILNINSFISQNIKPVDIAGG